MGLYVERVLIFKHLSLSWFIYSVHSISTGYALALEVTLVFFFYFGSLILLYLLTDVERLETVTGSRFFQSFTHSTTQTKPCPTINTVIAFQQPHQGLR